MGSESEEIYTCMMCKKIYTKYSEYGICDKCGTHFAILKNRPMLEKELEKVIKSAGYNWLELEHWLHI